MYETFDYMVKFVDPEFKYHQVMARFVIELGRRLIDAPLLPISVVSYGSELLRLRENLLGTFGTKMEEKGINLGDSRYRE